MSPAPRPPLLLPHRPRPPPAEPLWPLSAPPSLWLFGLPLGAERKGIRGWREVGGTIR